MAYTGNWNGKPNGKVYVWASSISSTDSIIYIKFDLRSDICRKLTSVQCSAWPSVPLDARPLWSFLFPSGTNKVILSTLAVLQRKLLWRDWQCQKTGPQQGAWREERSGQCWHMRGGSKWTVLWEPFYLIECNPGYRELSKWISSKASQSLIFTTYAST